LENKKCHLKNLKNTFSFSQSSSSYTCIIADEGVKDRTATTISYTWQANILHSRKQIHAMHASLTKAEIMSMCIGLEQALESETTNHINVITSSI